MAQRPRDESGVVAVLIGLLVVVLFSVAAISVDLGAAWVKKRDVQATTDFAALAGGAGTNLPSTGNNGTCAYGVRALAGDQAIKDVVDYVGEQAAWSSLSTAITLTDCDLANGEAMYGTLSWAGGTPTLTYNKNKLTVYAPPRRVDFGLANFMGHNGTDVGAQATVGIFSPKLNRVLPYYAAIGCDYGTQTIAQPSNGQSVNTVNLANGSDTNSVLITGLVTTPASAPTAASVDYPIAPNTPLQINGSGFTGATMVGFFETGTTTPGPAPKTIAITAANITNAGGTINLPDISLPNLAQDTWYIRVFNAGKWSPVASGKKGDVLNALPLTVGSPNLICSQGSSSGNFGSLLLPNSQGPNGQTDNIAYNIAAGLEHSLGIFPNYASPWTCDLNTTGAKLWPTEGTNCVDTKTGNIAADAAFSGLLTGVGGKQGLLTHTEAGTGCAADGTPQTTAFMSYTMNFDTLSCFFTDTTTSIGDIAVKNYSNPQPLLSAAIYNSPRFVYIPVLGVVPANGGSAKYQILEFRPAFITDQPLSATKSSPAPPCGGTACSGLSLSQNGKQVESLQVIMFNMGALPPPPDTSDVTDYTGTGQKVLRLID